ncbi:MAG: PmoA family protein [Acidobacteriota bacterium]|nr:PmoA family protein [Acidobacteriota bacterium]
MKLALSLALLAGLPLIGQVKITQGTDRVAVEIDGKPYTELFYGPSVYKPYLHPLRAATGTIVTRHFPMETVQGDSTDHPHHRGLWFGHGDVNGFDFWSADPFYKDNPQIGRIVVKSIDRLKSGAEAGSADATLEWREPTGKPLLAEKRGMVFHAGKDREIDFDFILTALVPVTFGDTKEGTFAMRLAAGLEYPQKKGPASPVRTGTMVNSEGGKGEAQCWGKRANWMDYYGELEGENVGIAIFDHPGNPRHPTYWHTRAYGLFAANIFGLRDFTGDKNANGSLTLKTGETLRFRYRVIIHPGDVDTAGIAERYEDYARIP